MTAAAVKSEGEGSTSVVTVCTTAAAAALFPAMICLSAVSERGFKLQRGRQTDVFTYTGKEQKEHSELKSALAI